MTDRVFEIAERLRRKPFHLFDFRRSNCIAKSRRFKRECRRIGVAARVVLCVGIMKSRPLGFQMTIPTVHAWGEVDGQRIEVAVPLGEPDFMGTVHSDIKPIIGIWF